MIDKVQYWIKMADYDYTVAQDLQRAKHWLYVAFMCHQVLEKTLKAYWVSTQPNDPPYVHNLARLAEGCGLNKQMNEEQNLFIETMTPMNIEARYPEYKEKLLKHNFEIIKLAFKSSIFLSSIVILGISSRL